MRTWREKLTDEQVVKIRELYRSTEDLQCSGIHTDSRRYSQRKLAHMYGVGQKCIMKIVRYETYRYLP